MRPWPRIVAWTVFIGTFLIAAVMGAIVAWLLSEVVPPGSTIIIDQHRFEVPALTHAGHYALVVLGVWLAALLIVAVAPILVLLGLVIPALFGALGVAVVVLLLGLVLWASYRMTRRVWTMRPNRPKIST
jgi:protein-S-isoprenylcysteine O-methyltransferase Ste14